MKAQRLKPTNVRPHICPRKPINYDNSKHGFGDEDQEDEDQEDGDEEDDDGEGDEEEDDDQEDDDQEDDDQEDDDQEDDDQEDDDPYEDDDYPGHEVPKPAGPPPACHLQSRAGTRRDGVYVTDWTMTVTTVDAQQKLLAHIDYWLGYDKCGKVRASKKWLYFQKHCDQPFLCCTASFIGRRIGKDKRAVHRLIERLTQPEKPLLIALEVKHRFFGRVLAVRINWPLVQKLFEQQSEDDGGDEHD